MPALLYNADNIVIGNAVAWFTPWVLGAVEPPPPDGTALFADWGDPWVKTGGTEEGWQIGATMDTQAHNIEEQSTQVAETSNATTFAAAGSLAEATLQSITLAWNLAPVTSTPAAAGTPGTDKTTLTDAINYYTFGFEMRNHHGFARRFYVPKCSVKSTDQTAFRRSAAKQLFPISVTSLCAPSEIQVIDITDAAL